MIPAATASRSLRKVLELTQLQLAKWLELQYHTVINIENGRSKKPRSAPTLIEDVFAEVERLDKDELAELVEFTKYAEPKRFNLFEAIDSVKAEQ
jgi:DNA-binding XRE family transcriptional regulator